MRNKHVSGLGTTLFAIAATLCAPSQTARCQTATFTGLGHLPGGTASTANAVSGDGTVVVGRSDYTASNGKYEAFMWTAPGGMVGMGDFDGGVISSAAYAASYDGSVIVGTADDAAFRWTQATGMVPIGTLGVGQDVALGVSPDGQVIVGWGESGIGRESFRWTAATGRVNIGSLGTTLIDSFASDVSADGNVICGETMSITPNVEPYRWTSSGGMVGLGDLPGGIFYGLGFALSDDGDVLVGEAISDHGWEALRWTPTGGLESLDPVLALQSTTLAHGISADGTVVVGSAEHLGGAMMWHEVWGFRGLQQILESDHSLNLTGWTLHLAEAISDDKTTIVGYGTNPAGNVEAWVATIPPPVKGDLDGDGDVDVGDYGLFAECLAGPNELVFPETCNRSSFMDADLDGDGDVDLSDFGEFAIALVEN